MLALFLQAGKKVATELIASLVSFDNSSTTLSSDNVQDALVEIATLSGAAFQFSVHTAKDGQSVVIPEYQQMIVCSGVCSEDTGGFCVEEDASIVII